MAIDWIKLTPGNLPPENTPVLGYWPATGKLKEDISMVKLTGNGWYSADEFYDDAYRPPAYWATVEPPR